MATITVDIVATGGAQFQREFERAAQTMGRTFPQASQKAEAQVKSMTRSLEVQSAVWARVQSQAIGAFAGAIGVSAMVSFTKQIVANTNALIGWQNALAAVTPSSQAAAYNLEYIRSEADRLGLELESLAGIFARFSAATRGTSLEGEQTREIFSAMAEAARVLNLSTDGVAGAFRALEQMVSKGSVQAEELRQQLGERLPGAFRMVADAMGVSTAELNKMLERGEVTAEEMLPKLAARLREVYSAASVGAANSPAAEFNRLANAMFDLRVAIGESGVMESLTRGSRQLTESLRTLVDGGALDKIASGLGNIALVTGVVFGGKALSAMGQYTAGLAAQAREQIVGIALDREWAAEKLALAKAKAADLAASVEAMAVARAEQAAKLSAVAAEKALAQEQVKTAARQLEATKLAYQDSGTRYIQRQVTAELNAATNALASAQARLNAVTNEYAVLGQQDKILRDNLTTASDNLIKAQKDVNAQMTTGQIVMQKFGASVKTVFNALGGWVTVAVAAAYALYQIQDAMRNGDAETQKMVSSLNDMSARMEKNAESALKMRQGVTSATVESSNAIQDMTANIRRLEEATESVIPTLDDWKSKLLAAGSPVGLIHAGVYERFRDTSAIDAANDALESHYQAMAKTVAVSNDVAKSYEEQARAVFVGSGNMDAYNKAIAEATPEMARAIIYSDDMSKAFENAASVLTKAGGDVDELRMEVMRLASDGKVNAREFAEVFEIVFGQVGKDAADLANKIGDTAVQIATAFGLMRRAGEGETESFALSKATQDYIDKLREEQAQLALSKEEMIRYTATKRIAAVHADESVKNKDAEIAAIVAETEALILSVHAADARKDAAKGLTEAEKLAAAEAKKAAEEAKKRADAYADSARTMIQLAGATNDLAGAESAYRIAVMDAMEVANQQIEAGMQLVDVQAQLSATIEAATAILEEQTAAVLENQRAHEQVLDDLELERKLIGMTDAERKKALAGLRAEQAMRQAIAVAQKAGAGLSAKQVQDYLDLARAAGIANAALDQYQQFLQQIGMTDAGDGLAAPIWEAVEASETLQDRLRDAFSDTGIEKLQDDVAKLGDLLGKLSKDDAGYAQVRLSYARANVELWEAQAQKTANVIGAVGGLTQAIGSMFAESESGQRKAAQLAAALAVAEQAALVPVMIAKASEAVANQAAKGDPYSAFARAAIMAGALAPFVAAVGGALPAFGSSGGPAANSAAYRQEHQGTGTVLGDAAAKSESIARATEITASATQQLVGINRSMLNAMNAMAAGLAGASTLLARGAGGVDIGPLRTTTGGFIGSLPDPLGITGNIFGGKESLRDQGIRIVGGTLSSMIDDIMVQSYASIHRSGGWFRSSRDYERTENLGDDVAAQFGLVLGSMADAVRAAADTLGLNMDAINAAIAAYRIEEIRISTMDLSAEEAQAELAAVFSSIFDGLAGAVVPFIAQFQQVGEGLGETLIRVATGVQVTQEAVIQLGFALDETDPEKFAQISEGLMSLMGGIDGFIEGMSSFVNAFATDEHKFAVAQDALTRAFEQFGMTVPESRDAMWDLMQGLDATTEAGREQIAMLLQLADVSDAYYSMLEDQAAAMARINDAIASGAWEQYLDTLEDGQRAIVELTKHYDDWRDSLIAAGATTEQLAAVEEQRAVALERLLAAAEAEYQATAQSIAEQLAIARGATAYMQEMVRIERQYQDQVRALNAHARAAGRASASERDLAMALELATIQRAKALMQLEQEAAALAGQLRMSALDAQIAQLSEIEGAATSAMTGFADAIGDAGRAAAEAMGLLLGSYSPLRASDKLPIALQALQRGETDANTVLQIARDVYASGAAYNAIFDQVMAITASQSSGRDVGGGSSAGSTRVSAEMQALLDQRAELEAQQAQRELFTQSSQLAAMIAELSSARGEDYDTIANLLQYDLSQLATDLGLDGLGALTEYLDNVAKEQASIADLFDLPTAGDLEIVGAINDLTDAIVGADFAPEDIPPIGDIPENTRDTEQQDQLAADTREMVTLLRAMVERGLPASEDTATAAERLVDAVERIGDAIESDGGAALAAETRRGV